MDSMVIVFSGFRDEPLKAQLEAKGAKVAGSLVKTATHVLFKKGGKPSKKLEEATSRGLLVIDLADFLAEHGLAPEPASPPKAAEMVARLSVLIAEMEKLRTDLMDMTV